MLNGASGPVVPMPTFPVTGAMNSRDEPVPLDTSSIEKPSTSLAVGFRLMFHFCTASVLEKEIIWSS